MVLLFHVGATIFLLLFIWKFPFGPLLAVASDKGKMPLKGENSVISLDDLVAEKIGAEGTSKFAEVDHPVNLISVSVQGNALCLPFLVFLLPTLTYDFDFVDVHDDSTPGTSAAVPITIPDSVTPATRLRTVRLKNPSKALLPPFSYIIPTDDEVLLYKKVIIHTKDEERSKIRKYEFLLLIFLCPFPCFFYIISIICYVGNLCSVGWVILVVLGG